MERFQRVSESIPCPICGRPDWCLIARDGSKALCQRTPSPTPVRSRSSFVGYEHDLNGAPPPPAAEPMRRLTPSQLRFLAEKFRKNLTVELVNTLAMQLGVSVNSLLRLGIGWSPMAGAYSFPMRNAQGEVTGIRYRAADGSKRSIAGGGVGVFLPTGLQPGRMLCLAEGPTDTAALLDLHLDVVGRPNDRGGVAECAHIIAWHKPELIVIVEDNDPAGSVAAESGKYVAEELSRLLGYGARGRRRIRRIRPQFHKDAREFVRRGGSGRDIMAVFNGSHSRDWREAY